mmetsp:Transcript_26987/g.75940  ORF Transcript_26987/g.75940 Transcript_26987/m.75940 type:complete len:163 (-) Transcript_26987:367-855(-)
MGETKNNQKQAKAELDDKLKLSEPSRQILEDLAVACAKDPSPDNTFQYAFCLAKSSERSELRYAVTILDGLVKEGYEHQVDCMYGAAVALYLLGEYDSSRNRCEQILRSRPESRTAAELHLACIESKDQKEKEEAKKMAATGVGAAVAVGLLAGVASLLLKR